MDIKILLYELYGHGSISHLESNIFDIKNEYDLEFHSQENIEKENSDNIQLLWDDVMTYREELQYGNCINVDSSNTLNDFISRLEKLNIVNIMEIREIKSQYDDLLNCKDKLCKMKQIIEHLVKMILD